MSQINLYKFAGYFRNKYKQQSNANSSPNDKNLAEYVNCSKMKDTFRNLVNSVYNFSQNNNKIKKEIKYEMNHYIDTTDDNDPDFFDNLITYLKTHSNEYTLQFGEELLKLNPLFIRQFKELYLGSEILQNDVSINALLELNNSDDMKELKSISDKYVSSMGPLLMAGLIEKIHSNFQGSEFTIGINLAIMDFNCRNFKLQSIVDSINKIHEYMVNNCNHSIEEITDLKESNEKVLNKMGYNSNGTINYNTILDGLSEERIVNVHSVRKTINILLNNSYNEIKIKTKISNMLLNDIFVYGRRS